MIAAKVTRYTIALTAIGLALSFGVYAAVRALLAQGNDVAATAVSDIGGTAIIFACAVVVLVTALRFGRGEAVRRQWALIGVGTLVYALGEATWTYFEVFRGIDPFPSLADVFYVLTYVLIGAGIITAALGYRFIVDLRRPALIAGAVSVVVLGVLYWQLLASTVADPELDLLSKVVSIFYPVGDVVFELAPALLIVLIAWHLGRGSFGWPWWPVALGIVLIAVSDSGFALLEAKGLYQAGSIIDMGWSVGNVLVASGALVARDVFGTRRTSPAARRRAA